jgi:hypothetical protein
MAIGASQHDIVRAMLGYSARLTGADLVIGRVRRHKAALQLAVWDFAARCAHFS